MLLLRHLLRVLEGGVIAPFPNLTALDVSTHKGFSPTVYLTREIKHLWKYRLITTSLLMDLRQAH
jgi:hypothetical protein